MSRRCHHCGKEWPGAGTRPGFKELCEDCGVYLHCCLNCRFYDVSRDNQCAAGAPEYVADKQKFNYCDDFEFRGKTDSREDGGAREAKRTLDGLFGASEAPEPDVDAFKRLFDSEDS